jgi:chromosome segregation ATPase
MTSSARRLRCFCATQEVRSMTRQQTGLILKELDARVTTVEQILPTLLTQDEFKTAMATVATKQELAEGLRGLRILIEDLRDQIKFLAEGLTAVVERLDRTDGRMDRLERDIAQVKMDVAQIKVDVAALQTDVTQINARNTIH